ncbi:hypothetical protein RFI_25665 [Reticulomyxa filosa]|uniref:Uncharacterized protein n=1 Tax=Reticulomyxa filosa TaxID=46433 RepID=X6ME53_RETFI|nr:hypothetical protein RFI_25665 [Reticulomyxa filosa]|eukprot:ETO11712.1 hypothetical protein RFI_25665 [Reticulomyxa filosa]
MGNSLEKKVSSTQQLVISLSEEEEIKIIVKCWLRISNIKLGWIRDFDKIVANYATAFLMLNTFYSSSKLLKTFKGHINWVLSIDCSVFDCDQFICSGSNDKTVRTGQIKLFNGHSNVVRCVKFSLYHYHKYRSKVICSSSDDKTIRFWDIKGNEQLQLLNGHKDRIYGIEFSSFSIGRYLCSGSDDHTIRLWDVETSKLLHIFDGHTHGIWCVDISPLQSNNSNDNKSNSIGVIGGNGYTICSGSCDKTIRIWDIETAKQLILFKGHEGTVRSVKYGSNKLGINGGSNTILSGSNDKSIRLWDIRSSQQIQVFNGHKNVVTCVEYSPFVVNNIEHCGNSNVICSGSSDGTIQFWDIRSNKEKLYVINGDIENFGVYCLKFVQFKKKGKIINNNDNINMCYDNIFFQIIAHKKQLLFLSLLKSLLLRLNMLMFDH